LVREPLATLRRRKRLCRMQRTNNTNLVYSGLQEFVVEAA
jgi:hypothetical protein